MELRPEQPGDADAIRSITQEAFAGAEHSSGTESAIIDNLMSAGTLSLSLVALSNDRIVGHVAFSPVKIAGGDQGWFGLGPVSVRPDMQGKGIGSRLIRESLAQLRAAGAEGCVVLGDPAYYRRFGFAADPALTFDGAPPEYFMALSFTGSSPSGSVTYEPAFYSG